MYGSNICATRRDTMTDNSEIIDEVTTLYADLEYSSTEVLRLKRILATGSSKLSEQQKQHSKGVRGLTNRIRLKEDEDAWRVQELKKYKLGKME